MTQETKSLETKSLETKSLETEAFAQPLELRADPFAAEFPLEPGDSIGARVGAQLGEPRHVAHARVFGRRGLRLYLRR